MTAPSFDPVWEEIYERGEQLNRYPYVGVVSFVFRNRPRDVAPGDCRILEVGFGAGNNLWFAAREGFSVSGVDASASAVAYAKQRFEEDGLRGDLRVGDFTELPFDDDSFDLAINRAAITQTGMGVARAAVAEVGRVLKPGGLFYNDLYSDRTTCTGRPGPDGVTLDVKGALSGIGQICFYGRRDVERLFDAAWTLEHVAHSESVASKPEGAEILASWNVVARRS